MNFAQKRAIIFGWRQNTQRAHLCVPQSLVSRALLQRLVHGTQYHEGNGNARPDNRKTHGSSSAKQASHQKRQPAAAVDLLARGRRVDDAGERSRQHIATHVNACTPDVITPTLISMQHQAISVVEIPLTGFAESAPPSLRTRRQHRQGYSPTGHRPPSSRSVHQALQCPEQALFCRRYMIRHRIVAVA